MDFGYLQEAARDDTGDDPSARGFYNPRVKVYRLNDDGKWVDKGTGHVSVEYLERLDAVGLVVIDEEDSKTLLIHRISSEEIYQRQEETIISWTDPEVSTDLALSFQETMGCNYIWEQVCSVQRQIQFPSVGLAEGPRQLSEELEHSGTSQEEDHFQETTVNDSVELPRPELSNLPQLAKIVSEVSPFHRERVASLMTRDPTYLKRLLDLFRFSEDLENTEGLHLMYKIVKGIIMLNDNSIFEIIFRDDCIMDIVGALEYDPEAPKKQEHRQYLKEQVLFKEAVPIRDPNTLSKIHQTYRIGYIKDVILPRALDDQTFGTLNSLMLFNHVEVISSLQNDRTFLGELFAALRARQDTDPSWQDIVYFLQEFCTLARHLQPQQRNHLYQSLIIAGLFEIGSRILQSPDEKLRLAGSDILMCTLTHDPASLRNFLADPKGKPLFGQLIKGMLTPSEGGLQAQLLEMMRMLLDSDSMEATEKSSFLDLFYDDFIEQLVATLVAGCKTGKEAEDVVTKHVVGRPMGSKSIPVKLPVEESLITAETLNHICELLTFCVQHHSFRIKYYVLRNNVVEKVLRLTRRRERYLVVAAIRFLRTCIGLKDDFYARYLIKNNLFAPVVEAFKANGDKYNMLNSAVIEMVDYIRKENMKALVCHLWETFGDFFSSVSYVDTFQNLQVKYNQILDGAGSQAPPMEAASRALGGLPGVVRDADHGSQKLRGEAPTGRAAAMAAAREMQMRRRRDGSMDQDEEAYFNSDGDDEDESEHHINARIDQLRGGPPLIEGLPLPQPTANGGEPNPMGMRNPFGLVDYEDEDEESPPGSSDGGNGPNSGRQEGRQDGHQQGPHLWPGGQQRTGIWGDGMALKRGPLLREGALGFPNGSNYDRGPLRVAKRVSPGRDHGPRRAGREMELALDREEYEEKMKRRRMMQAKANGEAAFEEQRRSARERGWKSARSKWREHLLKRERHAMDGLRPGNLHPLEEEASQTLQGLGERVLGQRNEPHHGGEGGDVHESPERLRMRAVQSGEMIQPETAQDILMGVDLPNMDAIEACDPGGGPFTMQDRHEENQGGGLGVGGPVSSNSGEGLPTEQSVNQILLEQPDPAGANDAGARSQEREEAGAELKEGGPAPGEWQGDLDFQGDFSNAKEPDSLKAKLDSEQAPSQELLGIGSDLARNNPTPEPYEVR